MLCESFPNINKLGLKIRLKFIVTAPVFEKGTKNYKQGQVWLATLLTQREYDRGRVWAMDSLN